MAMTVDEVCAVVRLRQWRADKTHLLNGKMNRFQSSGWRERRQQDADARLVRVIDFEQALLHLPEREQKALILFYGEKQPVDTIAFILGCSLRTVGYILPAARKHLADTLARLDLL